VKYIHLRSFTRALCDTKTSKQHIHITHWSIYIIWSIWYALKEYSILRGSWQAIMSAVETVDNKFNYARQNNLSLGSSFSGSLKMKFFTIMEMFCIAVRVGLCKNRRSQNQRRSQQFNNWDNLRLDWVGELGKSRTSKESCDAALICSTFRVLIEKVVNFWASTSCTSKFGTYNIRCLHKLFDPSLTLPGEYVWSWQRVRCLADVSWSEIILAVVLSVRNF